MRTIDLRSDTITRPTEAMRKAMASAEVGDDVFGEDPTINRLEDMAAACVGKEASLFVPSGTMGNLVSLLTHCGRGDEILLGDRSHTFLYEQGGAASLGGIHPRTLPNLPDGTMDLKALEDAIRPENIHFPRTRLILLENTHNRCHGQPLELAYMNGVGLLARRHGLKVHVDGARIFHAAVALNVDVATLVADAHTLTFCLSKGLAAPVGSLVCGPKDFILEARRARKVVGGGMRQAGILAAAGIVALQEMRERLVDDHSNARVLAHGLADVSGLLVETEKVKTNMVYVNIQREDLPAHILSDRLAIQGVLLLPTGPYQMRAVTHYHIEPPDIEETIRVFHRTMRS